MGNNQEVLNFSNLSSNQTQDFSAKIVEGEVGVVQGD